MMLLAAKGCRSFESFTILMSRFAWHHVGRQRQAIAAYANRAYIATRALFPPDHSLLQNGYLDFPDFASH